MTPNVAEAIEALSAGESMEIGTIDGEPIVVDKDMQGNITITPTGQMPAAACTWAVASAVYEIGAGVLAADASAAGGIVVAGYFISASQLGAMAGLTGSFSAIYAFVAANVC
ncbi:hypothetical protein [Actinopolyspora mortivallis]|uniref:hypothetical protein n=1 Tax=Actinopolyspora mortivallis TaxID=33906 RepID=UPI00036D00EE|nr:hypothetical protein [Actinopolyspora mortivallis]